MEIKFSFNEQIIQVKVTCFVLKNGIGYSFYLNTSNSYFIETMGYDSFHIGAINPIDDWDHEKNKHPCPQKFSEEKWKLYKVLTNEIRSALLR